MIQPPFRIIAAALCPGSLSAGQVAPNTRMCTVTKGLTGTFALVLDDDTVDPTECVLLLSPGGGTALDQGVSFGQSTPSGNTFGFKVFRNDTGAAADLDVHALVVTFPAE